MSLRVLRLEFLEYQKPRDLFFAAGKRALLAYVITAALIEYAFPRDGMSGGPLIVLTLSIIVYAIHVPVLIAFTVSRYE